MLTQRDAGTADVKGMATHRQVAYVAEPFQTIAIAVTAVLMSHTGDVQADQSRMATPGNSGLILTVIS